MQPSPTEATTAYDALNSFGSWIAGGYREDDEAAPKGFINILVFNQDYELMDFAYKQIDANSKDTSPHQLLSIQSIVRQPGYAYVFLSNEGATEVQIGFDDYEVTHSHSDIIQEDSYYPFGLTFASYQKSGSLEQRWKFQKQEHINALDLGWVQFKWRNAMPDIGRFFNVDPLAEKYVHNSTYAFSENKVVAHIELEGLESWSIHPHSHPLNGITEGLRKFSKDVGTIIDKAYLAASATFSNVISETTVNHGIAQTTTTVSEDQTTGVSFKPTLSDFFTNVNNGPGGDGGVVDATIQMAEPSTSVNVSTTAKVKIVDVSTSNTTSTDSQGNTTTIEKTSIGKGPVNIFKSTVTNSSGQQASQSGVEINVSVSNGKSSVTLGLEVGIEDKKK